MVTRDAFFGWPIYEKRVILDKTLRRKLENLANTMLEVQKPLIERGEILHYKSWYDSILIDCMYYPRTKTLHFY